MESTAFVPARATDLTKPAGERQKQDGDVLTAAEVQRNPDFLHRWRVGEHDLYRRLKRRDSFVSLLQAKQQQQQAGGDGVGGGSGMGGDGTPSPQKRHAVRDHFGRFIRSPPGSAKAKAASKPVSPPPPPVTTSSGRVVKRRLDFAAAAAVDGGSAGTAGAAAITAAGTTEASTATTASDDNDRTGSLLTTQQPSYSDPLSYADHPRLISNEPAPQIGPGWTLIVVGRPGYDDPNRDSKKRGGRFDRYYFSPEGRRFKNIAEVNKYKHDMEMEHGVVVAGNVARPLRVSSRVKRLQEEAKEEEERRAKEEERMELEAEAAAMLGVEVGDIPDEAISHQDDYDKKTGAGAGADGCGTCQHFPFCSHAPPSPGKKKSGSSGGATSDPFLDDESVIWVPTTRSQWDDCVDEMTSVCYSAVLRKHQQEQVRLEMEGGAAAAAGGATGSGAKDGKGKTKPPLKPLSRDYIRDRIDIDDPIRGYQIRHKTGGWLQGFVLTTTFTTWTHYFKWDSTHPTAGLRGSTFAKAAASAGMVGVDFDGSLSSQLEAQPRSGDPNHGGVVWPTIAEISLVGALGCGEYLVRMALDDICRRDCYDYVVLQATDTSRTFYERFGFVRVGAVSKYGRQARQAAGAGKPGAAAAAAASAKGTKGSKPQAQQTTVVAGAPAAPASSAVSPPSLANAPLVGYRHWTYAEESAQSINKWHGGPSYMMALKIDRSKMNPNAAGHHCVECGRAVSKVSFLDALADHFVHEKPKIMNLGGNIGRRKPSNSWSPVPPAVLPPLVSSKPGALASAQAASGKKRWQAHASLDGPRSKKARRPVTPVGNGRFSAEFERRQMNDPWLAVKPAAKLVNSAAGRKPPRSRSDGPQPTKTSTTPKAKARKSSKPSTPKSPPLRKQRIPPMYRDPKKTYYYNRTVKPKKKTKSSAPYYFVLNFDESTQKIQLIPLEVRGTFIGRRVGRPKWKATVLPRPAPIPGVSAAELERRYFASMGVFTASAKDYIIVNSDSVHKCATIFSQASSHPPEMISFAFIASRSLSNDRNYSRFRKIGFRRIQANRNSNAAADKLFVSR